MVSGKYKSRTYRRIHIKTPGRRNIIHYKRRKPSKAHCAECRAVLSGVPRELPYKMQNMPKTKKRPERPYGGMLCSKCARKRIISEARSQ